MLNARFAAALLILCAPVFAQISGPNVNMVSGTTWPGGDPFLQRQNEPSMAVSSVNPSHLFALSNDYRTVDIPGITGGVDETGDSWLGVFKSFDGGRTWRSTVLPGCPYNTAQCTEPYSPAILQPLGLQAASDPTVRPGTNGLLFASGIAFRRGTNAPGVVFVSRF